MKDKLKYFECFIEQKAPYYHFAPPFPFDKQAVKLLTAKKGYLVKNCFVRLVSLTNKRPLFNALPVGMI